jgi:hypothetical protein
MGEVTHEQANLMLRLYDLRRETRLRQARTWFVESFSASTPEEMLQKYPKGTEEITNVRMVVSYWDMAAGIVNRGLIDDEFFFESNGEAWVVWEKIRHLAASMRATYKNPSMFAHLEAVAKRLEEWRERRAPGSSEVMRKMFAQQKAGQ